MTRGLYVASPDGSSKTSTRVMVLAVMAVITVLLIVVQQHRRADGAVTTTHQDSKFMTAYERLQRTRPRSLVIAQKEKSGTEVWAVTMVGSQNFCSTHSIQENPRCIDMRTSNILTVLQICGEPGAPPVKDCADRFFTQ
jgi:hypothetical protein